MDSPYSGILFSNKKEYSNDVQNNLNQFQEHYAKWRMKDTKDYILVQFHLCEILDEAKYIVAETSDGWREGNDYYKGVWGTSVSKGNILYPDYDGRYKTVHVCWNTSNHILKLKNFITCKLYLNKADFKKSYKLNKYLWYHITYLHMFLRKILILTINLYLSHSLFLSSLNPFLKRRFIFIVPPLHR